jgi:hypothetical protein
VDGGNPLGIVIVAKSALENTMKEDWKLHECGNLPSNGVQILYAMDNVERKAMTWRLIIRREATEEDLEENHYLEVEGETLWETSLEIIHCPFCGKNLLRKKDKIYEDHGKFSHDDFSGWAGKRQ